MDLAYPGVVQRNFSASPKGIILHGSRSGATTNTTAREYLGTANFAVRNTGELGWNATIGDDQIALHMSYSQWGWNARAASPLYLAVEFAQPVEAAEISDAQVRAFVWFARQARNTWPKLPAFYPTHAELDGNETGKYDGKTDVFRTGSQRTTELRARIAAAS